jgi:hypothetical protein
MMVTDQAEFHSCRFNSLPGTSHALKNVKIIASSTTNEDKAI